MSKAVASFLLQLKGNNVVNINLVALPPCRLACSTSLTWDERSLACRLAATTSSKAGFALRKDRT